MVCLKDWQKSLADKVFCFFISGDEWQTKRLAFPVHVEAVSTERIGATECRAYVASC